MKNKGTIKFFAIALALVALFHLSFTLVTYLNEKKAKDFSRADALRTELTNMGIHVRDLPGGVVECRVK